MVLAYSPCDNSDLEKVMTNTRDNLNLPKLQNTVKCFEDGKMLENALKNDRLFIICGIQFDDDLAGNKALHKNMKVTIR